MQVCTSLQTDNHACTPQLIFFRPDALLAAQPTASKALKARIHTQTDNYHISAFSNSDEIKTNHVTTITKCRYYKIFGLEISANLDQQCDTVIRYFDLQSGKDYKCAGYAPDGKWAT